jgi:phosphatidylglycerophosphatase A
MTSPTESPNPVNPSTDFVPPKPLWFVRAFASGLFSGYSPIATGTVGSAVGLLIYFLPGFEHPYVIMPACFAVLLLGIVAADQMEKIYGHDPAEVTIDEILGMWISLLFLPKSLLIAITAFIIFRLMDIMKPFPARRFDAARGGFGIMFDDVVAGTYANLLTHLLLALGLVS